MNYCDIKTNDISAAPGVSVTLYVSGCENHCPGCHNPETWDFNFGTPIDRNFYSYLIDKLVENGIKRNFCIMGGEPLHPKNREEVYKLIAYVKDYDPNIEIWIWSGYIYENLLVEAENDQTLDLILSEADVLVDGPFILSQRDITLKARGSRNQRIIYLQPQ